MRLAKDILISAVGGVLSAAVGFLTGLFLCVIVFLVLFRGSDAIGDGILILLILFSCTLMGGMVGFPFFGIWVNKRRQKRRL